MKPWRDAEIPLSQKEASIEILLSYSMLNDVESWDTRNLLQDLVRRDQLIMKRLDTSLQSAIRSNPNYEPYLASCQGIYRVSGPKWKVICQSRRPKRSSLKVNGLRK